MRRRSVKVIAVAVPAHPDFAGFGKKDYGEFRSEIT